MNHFRARRALWFLFGCMVLSGPCSLLLGTETPPVSGSPSGSRPAAGDPALTNLLKRVLQKHDLPALAAAVVTSKGIQKQAVAGIRKWGTDVPATLDDLWHLGSDTKAMTATLAAKLVERGALKWTNTVSDLFPDLAPEFHEGFKKVTVLELLTHRAGVAPNLTWAWFVSRTVQEQRLAAVRKGLSEEPTHPPGTKYLYSNLGYVIVGAIIERLTGISWEEAMRKEIFSPLGMNSAGFGGLGTPDALDQPWGHSKLKEPVPKNGPTVDNPPVLGPAGRVHCTMEDWAKFISDQLRGIRGEKGLLKAESYQTLIRPPFAPEPGNDWNYALGWLVTERPWGGGIVYNHNGCNTMFFATAWLAPNKDFAVLVCSNEGLDAQQPVDEAVGEIIKQALGQ